MILRNCLVTRKLRVVNPVSLILEAIQASPRVSVSETSPSWAPETEEDRSTGRTTRYHVKNEEPR